MPQETPVFLCNILRNKTVSLLLLSCRSPAHTYCDNSCIHPLSPRPIYGMLAPACYRQLKTSCFRRTRPRQGWGCRLIRSGGARLSRWNRASGGYAASIIAPGMIFWRPRQSGVSSHGRQRWVGQQRSSSLVRLSPSRVPRTPPKVPPQNSQDGSTAGR